jgi:U3 small nucleolar RNA-associated protein MPP10
MAPATAALFLQSLQSTPYDYLQPTTTVRNTSLSVAKELLDPLAFAISTAQLARLQENRKRKRRERHPRGEEEVLRLKKVHTEGFEVDQVWEQARRVVAATIKEIERDDDDEEKAPNGVVNGGDAVAGDEDMQLRDAKGEDWDEAAFDELDDELQEAHSGIDEDAEDEMDDLAEDEELDDADDIADDYGSEVDSDVNENGVADKFVKDIHGLNDGFFSIDDFNRQTEFLEQVDARGDLNDGAASDEEEVEWDANPMAARPRQEWRPATNGRQPDPQEEDSEDDENGPTFGDMNIDAPEGASDEEAEGEDFVIDDGGDGNANHLMYKDFFAPPARKKGPKPKKRPSEQKEEGESFIPLDTAEDEMERTMAAVHRELFSDDEDEKDEEKANADRSTHERRQAALLEEIRQLEAENVAKRKWTLTGEARAADRPMNSLLEEDLDFERAGKPVPVITQEVTEDIEAMIKRRILGQEFDEVLRRRPDEALSGHLGRRGVLEEVQDTKSKKGLAEIYEEEHLKRTDANYQDEVDEQLKTEHREIEAAWKDLVGKLDSLASWNYRPRPVEMSIQVRSDAPVVSMEDARPSGVGGTELATTSHLAPQEVYKAGTKLAKGEVARKGGLVFTKDELSRDDKKRLRRQEKGRAKMTTGANGVSVGKGRGNIKTQEKNKVVGDLKKGGVKVIDRKGNLVDVEGKDAKGQKAAVTGGRLKL